MKNVKFVKKALAMVLAAAMSLSLAACGSGAASSASAASTAGSTPAAPAAEEKTPRLSSLPSTRLPLPRAPFIRSAL